MNSQDARVGLVLTDSKTEKKAQLLVGRVNRTAGFGSSRTEPIELTNFVPQITGGNRLCHRIDLRPSLLAFNSFDAGVVFLYGI